VTRSIFFNRSPVSPCPGPLAPLAPLSGIKALILPCNGLSGPVEALRGLVNLRDLDLSGNKLTGPVDALMSLGQLVELNLGDNSLSDTLDAFAGLRRLRRLVLRNNQFWGPLAMLDGLASGSLEVLDLSGDANCGLGGPRPPEISRKWSAGGLNLNTTGTQVGLRGPTEPTDGRPRTGDGRPRTGGARSRPSSPLMALMSLAQASQGKRNGGISLVGRISSTDARASALQRAKAHPKGPPAELLAAKAKPLTDDQANEVLRLILFFLASFLLCFFILFFGLFLKGGGVDICTGCMCGVPEEGLRLQLMRSHQSTPQDPMSRGSLLRYLNNEIYNLKKKTRS